MDPRERRGGRPVGIGNMAPGYRSDEPVVPSVPSRLPGKRVRPTPEMLAMLGTVVGDLALALPHLAELTVEQEADIRAAIGLAGELDLHHVTNFHRGLPLREQDEIRLANGTGLVGVHMGVYALLREGGIDHNGSLVISREAARIQYGSSDSAE
jgi:hypothetical protein